MIRSQVPVLLALTLLAVPGRVDAQGPLREVVVPPGGTAGRTFSPAIRTGNLLFVTGQLGAGADIGSQTTAALESIKRIVEAGGTTMANVVNCTMFITDVADYAGMNDAWRPFFPEGSLPSRTTVQIAKLLRPDAKVEISCIAAVPSQ